MNASSRLRNFSLRRAKEKNALRARLRRENYKDGRRFCRRFRLCYPWAIAPTINRTKPVATAIATFVSTDKFIIFPFNYGGDPVSLFLYFPFLDRFEFPRAYGCHAQRREKAPKALVISEQRTEVSAFTEVTVPHGICAASCCTIPRSGHASAKACMCFGGQEVLQLQEVPTSRIWIPPGSPTPATASTCASDLIIPRLRRLFFAGVPERCKSDRLLASPGIAQTPIVPAASARF